MDRGSFASLNSLAAKFNPNWEFNQLNQDRENLIQLIVSVCKFMIEGESLIFYPL